MAYTKYVKKKKNKEMEKIPIAKIVEFRRKKTDSSKATLINNLKKPKEKKSSSDGGNYWTTSISSIRKYFKTEDSNIILEKISDLLGRYDLTAAKISKTMYQLNVEILHNFENFSFNDFKPKLDIEFITQPNDKSIINVNNVQIQVRPQNVYTYKEQNVNKIGGIWFVAKKGGYEHSEIGIFTEALYKYLNINFSKKFEIDPKYCIAIDVVSLKEVRQSQINNKEINSLLSVSLESMKKFF